MAESSMAEGRPKRTHVWGAKVGSSNYKSVTIDDEVYALGDCVRRPLDNKPEHVGKIVKLFEKDGKGMCRLRSFYTTSEVTESAKGLESALKPPKEVFLASGDGPGVEIDSLLEKIEGKCTILCTAEESFNDLPSPEQLEAADYFFSRAYDPAGEEVVGLDTVEEAIGAQKVYNKKEWLLPADSILSRSTSQVSSGKVQRQSPAVSGSSSHQGGAKAMPSTVVSPAPSSGSLKEKKSEVPEPSKDDAVESKKKLPLKGETSAMKSGVSEPSKDDVAQSKKDDAAQSKKDDAAQIKKKVAIQEGTSSATFIQPSSSGRPHHITFGIPAHSRVLASGETEKALPVKKQGEPPISKPKAVTPGGKGVPVKGPSPIAGLKKKVLTKGGAVLMKKRKLGDTEDGGGAVSGEKRMKLHHVPTTEVGAAGATSEKKKQQDSKLTTDVGAAATFEKKKQQESKLTTEVGAATTFEKKKQQDSKLTTEVGAAAIQNKSKLETKLGAVSGEKKSITVTKPSTEVGEKKRKEQESEPILELAPKKVVKPMERSNLSSERESPTEFLDRSLAIASPPAPEQKHHGQIFKPRVEDWEVQNLIPAINSNRVLLLENVDAELHSDDLAEALTVELKVKCDVRIAPLLSPHFRTTSALLKLPSRVLAQQVLEMMNSSNVIIRSRLVSATVFRYSDFKAPTSKHFGHIEFAKENRDFLNEDYRDALATSHFAQGNTIEFDYGLPWKVLSEQHDEQWKLLQKHVQDTNPSLKI